MTISQIKLPAAFPLISQPRSNNMKNNNYFPTIPYLTPETSQKFFGVVLTLCALVFFGFFAIKPTVSTILQLQKEVSDNEYVLSQLETKIKNLAELRKQYFNLRNDLPFVTNAITAQPDAHLLFAQIQSIAASSGVSIKKLQNFEVEVLKSSTNKNYYSYTFALAGSGSLNNTLNFVQTLIDMERIINIDTLSISKNSEQAITFDIQGVSFFKNN